MLENQAAVVDAKLAEPNALATSQGKKEPVPFLFKDKNTLLREKIGENEKYRDILIQIVKRRLDALLPPEANRKGAGEHAGEVTNTNNANHPSSLLTASALSNLPVDPDHHRLLQSVTPKKTLQHISLPYPAYPSLTTPSPLLRTVPQQSEISPISSSKFLQPRHTQAYLSHHTPSPPPIDREQQRRIRIQEREYLTAKLRIVEWERE
ncbi:hypothetical protein COCCADRAFT_28679 [Bipolaris zeicola 26-R-13]|uniref:Uncharacterized protein n=1 Tax=Cochliobolus carbonum (strain 26-R-13) TaxID=930089 RepID=W6YGM3_COCC2|nr:uncharacterized protein COCCADRAFT_28679 [Bipolaris zeicola 26-R-13]EUC30436.1 hypothetical protein COCCADRAFT_28679 [Bipolaris zeicola 26-R-13]